MGQGAHLHQRTNLLCPCTPITADLGSRSKAKPLCQLGSVVQPWELHEAGHELYVAPSTITHMGYIGFVIILDLCFRLAEIMGSLMMQDSDWEGGGIGKAEEEEENGCTHAPRGAKSVSQGGFCRLPDQAQGIAV